MATTLLRDPGIRLVPGNVTGLVPPAWPDHGGPPPTSSSTPLEANLGRVRERLTDFHLVLSAVDPFTQRERLGDRDRGPHPAHLHRRRLPAAWPGHRHPDEARMFLGPWAEELLTFADPDRTAVQALGIEALPALVHIGADLTVVGKAEGLAPRRVARRGRGAGGGHGAGGRPASPTRVTPARSPGPPPSPS